MKPGWVAPGRALAPTIRVLTTTRTGGSSTGIYAGLNLALHAGDEEEAVYRNRRRLHRLLALPSEPLWMRQVHGTRVIRAEEATDNEAPAADAAVATMPGRVLAVLTADCLPVVLAARDGSAVGIAHAGWRGLSAGVIEATLGALGVPAHGLAAWIGPGIGAAHYEVDRAVHDAFADAPGAAQAFVRGRDAGHWYCDLAALAAARLGAAGVNEVESCGLCTYADAERFYSYRRDGETGRMATLAWIEPA